MRCRAAPGATAELPLARRDSMDLETLPSQRRPRDASRAPRTKHPEAAAAGCTGRLHVPVRRASGSCSVSIPNQAAGPMECRGQASRSFRRRNELRCSLPPVHQRLFGGLRRPSELSPIRRRRATALSSRAQATLGTLPAPHRPRILPAPRGHRPGCCRHRRRLLARHRRGPV